MRTAPLLSVVVPVRDEVDSLEPLHGELDAALSHLHDRVELIFVDDASRDASRERLLGIARKDPRVRVLALDRHGGQSAALDAGFRAARGALVATLDADLQNDPADLPRLLALLEETGVDVVNGVRVPRRDALARRLASRIANAVRNLLTADGARDIGCSLRVMRAECLRRVPPLRGMHRYLPTFLRLEGARVREVPVSHRPRRYGRSKYGILERLRSGAVDVLGVRWLASRWLRTRARELDVAKPQLTCSLRRDPGAPRRSARAAPGAATRDGGPPGPVRADGGGPG